MFAVLNDVFDVSVAGDKPPMGGACFLINDADDHPEQHPRADATFLFLYWLEKYSAVANIIFISCLRDFEHYKICGAKSGLRFHASFKSLEQQFIGPNEIMQNCMDEKAMKNILRRVVQNIRDDDESKHVIVLADADILVNLSQDGQHVQTMIAALQSLCKDTALVVHMHSNKEDEENLKLMQFLSHRAHWRAECRAFKSGYSNDFDGELQIFKQSAADVMFFECVRKRFLYKVGDRRFTLNPLE